MYKILNFENGQPFILYRENESVHMYTIASGRIHSKGIIFNDVKSNFSTFKLDENYIYYVSLSNQIKIYKNVNQIFNEILSIEIKNSNYNTLIHNNTAFLFYQDNNSIFYLDINYPNKSNLALRFDTFITDYYVFVFKDQIHLLININDELRLYMLDENFNCKEVANINGMEQSKIENFNKLIQEHKSKISLLNEQNEKLQMKLSEMDLSISKYKSTQEYITSQYNDLADYAGKLQDELRKFRYSG